MEVFSSTLVFSITSFKRTHSPKTVNFGQSQSTDLEVEPVLPRARGCAAEVPSQIFHTFSSSVHYLALFSDGQGQTLDAELSAHLPAENGYKHDYFKRFAHSFRSTRELLIVTF